MKEKFEKKSKETLKKKSKKVKLKINWKLEDFFEITPLWKEKLTIDYKRFNKKNHWEIFINSGVYFETHCSSINLSKSENSLVGFEKKNLSSRSDNSINQLLRLNIWRSQKQHQEFSFKSNDGR